MPNSPGLSDLTIIKLLIMGWLSLRSRLHGPTSFEPTPSQGTSSKSAIEHAEHVEDVFTQPPEPEYPHKKISIPDDDLPFIPPAIVRNQRSHLQTQGLAWIVVDNIVYDCATFINHHPGGDTVIRSFIGEDCSWQFWRFHSKMIMEKWGRPLRVGRTEGIVNRFKEPPRYFGSRNR